MAQAIPPILVQIQADVTQLKAGLAQAEASIKGMDGSVATANTGMQNMIASAKKMAATLGVAFAATQIVQFGKDVVMSASAMEESMSKVNVVFGQGASKVFDFGDKAAKSMGMSNQAAIEAAGTYGNLFQAFGIGQGKATEMSTTLVQLAADLGSFNNTSTEDAINALRSGLAGETEPLKRYGVALNEVTLKNKAMAMGFGEIKGAMDPAIKAQVTYALVMEQTKLAQGDYQRTSSGTANTMKTLSAQFADAKVAIGQALMPAFTLLLNALKVAIPLITGLTKFFKDNSDALKMYAIILGTATAAFYGYRAAIIATKATQQLYIVVTTLMKGATLASIASTNGLAASMLALNAAMRANPIGLIVTALTVLGAAFVYAWKKSETFRGIVIAGVQMIVNGFALLVQGFGKFTGLLSKVPGMGWAKGISDGAKNAAESLKTTSKNLSDLKSSVKAGYGEGAFTYGSGSSKGDTGGGGTGGGGAGNAAAAAKAAKDKADKIKKSMDDVKKIYDKMNKEILEAQEKVAEATKRRDEDTAEAHKRYNETIADADKTFMEASAEANERYNERVADVEKRYAETKASLHKRNQETIGSATKAYNDRVADLHKRFEEQTAKAQEAYAERKLDIEEAYLDKKEDLNKKHAETVEKINETYNEKYADLQKRFEEQSIKAQKTYTDKKESIETNYADKVADLKKNLAAQTIKLESDAAKKSADLTKAASDKQLSIVQDSINRLRSAFASKTGANLSDAMGEDKSAGSLLANLKAKLAGAKDLAKNAALLQGQGFSQTFIEQVVAAGPEVGNSLAGSILNASPEAIAELQATFVGLEKTSTYGLDALATTMNAGGKLATDELMNAYRGVSEDLALALTQVQTDLTENLAEANTKYQEAMTAAATVRAEGLAAAKAALDEALISAKTAFDEGVVAATKTMNDALLAANKALAEGLAEAEKARAAALAEADKTLKAALAEAKKSLDEALAEAAKALAEKIAEANKDLEEGLAEADKDLKEALAEAKKDLDKALAAADKTYKEALADAQKTLTETLAAVQKTYKESLDQIAKDTDASIAALKVKLAELAATLKDLGAKQAAVNALANAPKPTVVTSGATSNAGSTNTTTLAGINAASGVTINQTINNTNASASSVADATLTAIKFGTAGGYYFSESSGVR
jgi:hypothetical protein